MTMPVNTFQDILDALEQNPHLRKQLRAHILTEELFQLPAQFLLLRADVDTLKAGQEELQRGQGGLQRGQAELQRGQAELQRGQAALHMAVEELQRGQANLGSRMNFVEGRMGNIDGHLYEQRSVNRVLVRVDTLGIEGGRIAYAKAGQTRQKFHDVMTSAVREARITQEEYVDLSEADAIIRGRNQRHAVVEISLGADEDDISRAVRRAQTLQAAIGETVVPVVATPSPHPAFIQAAERRNVQVLDVPA